MLKVIWLGILILAYLVSRSLQLDSASQEDDGIQQRYKNLKLINSKGLEKESLDNRLEYLIRQAKSENDGGHPQSSDFVNGNDYDRTVHSNGPKRVKLTYKKRTKISKNSPYGSGTNNENSNSREKMFEDLNSLNSEDAKLLPVWVKYLNEHGSEKHSLGDIITNKEDFIAKLKSTENNNENENKDLRKYNLNHHDWSKLELNSNKVFENKPEEKKFQGKSVIGTIYFPNTNEFNENGPHNSNINSEKVTTKDQVGLPSGNGFSNIYNQEGENRVTTLQWNSNPLGADNEGKEVSKTAVSNDLDPSQIDILVKKMCVNSKTNFLEFWKLAAGYFGLNHGNLSDQQKYDLFLNILQKVNDYKQHDVVETVSPESEYELSVSKQIMPQEVIPSENTQKFHWHDYSEPEEIQIQKQNVNEAGFFSGPNQKVVNGLGTDEILVSNKNKPDKYEGVPIKKAPVQDNFRQHWNNGKVSFDIFKSSKTNTDLSTKPSKSSEILLNYFNSELRPKEKTVISIDSNGEESEADSSFNIIKTAETHTDTDFPYSEAPQVAISDSNYKSDLIKLNENKDLEPVAPLTPNLDKNIKLHHSNEDKEEFDVNKNNNENTDQNNQKITYSQTVHVNSGLINKKPAELSTLILPDEKNNDSDKQAFNNLLDYLNASIAKEDAKPADNLYITLDTKQKSSENIANESSGSKNKPPNLIDTNKEILNLSKLLSKNKSFNDVDESQSSQENDAKRLAVLVQYLKTLPKDKLAKIILTMKYNIGHKNNVPEDLKYFSSLFKSTLESDENDTDKLKILVQYLEGQSKDKVTSALLDSNGNEKLHSNLLLKYNLALKNKQHPDDYQFIPYTSLDDSILKSNEYGINENSRRPKLHLKWNITPNVLTQVLLQIISRFREYGLSDEALRTVIIDLKQALSENEGKTDCETQELNKKLNGIMKSFVNLSSLKKQADAKKTEV